MRKCSALLGSCLVIASGSVASSELVLPTPQEAKGAIVELMGLADRQDIMTVTLGTCIPALEAQHAGQAACTVAIKIGGGTTETQADFYKAGGGWAAQPSVSQDELPFPDPALRANITP